MDRNRFHVIDHFRRVGNHVNLHALSDFHHLVFYGHHLLPVKTGFIDYALYGLLGGIQDPCLLAGHDGHRNCSFYDKDCPIPDFFGAGPVLVIGIEADAKIGKNLLVVPCCRTDYLFVFSVVDCHHFFFIIEAEAKGHGQVSLSCHR